MYNVIMLYWQDMIRKVIVGLRLRGVIIFLLGVLFGGGIFYTISHTDIFKNITLGFYTETEYDPSFQKVVSESDVDPSVVNMQEFWEVWRTIEDRFVPDPHAYAREEDLPPEEQRTRVPNEKEFIKGAINGLTWSTKDIYTNFFNPTEADDFTEEIIDGEIDGIGAYIGIRNGSLRVIQPLDDSPAGKAGLKAGDIIRKINGVDAGQYNLFSATEQIRGVRGTEVILTVFRPSSNEELDITIVRDRVEVPTLTTEVRDDVFVITLHNFSRKATSEFQDAIIEFAERANSGGADKIVLDLRGNSGGILSAAITIAGFFLPKDSVVLYEYSGSENLRSYKTRGPIFRSNIPKLTILIDESSASASEILAAALHHHNVADIVGLTSFGKGSVQSLVDVGDDALLKITIAHWLTPDKHSITGVGIEPDVNYEEDLRAAIKENEEIDVREYLLERAVSHIRER